MLLFLILLILVNASIFLILFYELKELKEEYLEMWGRINKLEKKLFGNGSDGTYSCVAFALMSGEPQTKGLFQNFKNVCDKNNDYFNTKIKALENHLKIEYIDEKKIINGREEEAFKGYRHKAKK